MRNKVVIIFLLVLVIGGIFYVTKANHKVPYEISQDNVKSIYCEYYMWGTKVLEVNESDKKVIISEISDMRETKTSGEVGTVSYKFFIELTDGHKVNFIQNTEDVIELYSDIDNRQRKIKAPQTSEFIRRFIKENNFQM